MDFHKSDTALVVIDPQNDVLSERGVSWKLVGASVKENNTVENLARLFAAAKAGDLAVFVSPHFLFPYDQAWQYGGLVEKIYWVVVEGQPPEAKGRIETGLKKLTRGTGWRMVVDSAGQRAVTDYRLLGADHGRAWLELQPRTGRTHQLRVHCATLGCPVVGDHTYGNPHTAEALQLYARSVTLPLYPARPSLQISAPVPPHMLAALALLGYDPASDPPEAATA